jgi:hypothetical protein
VGPGASCGSGNAAARARLAGGCAGKWLPVAATGLRAVLVIPSLLEVDSLASILFVLFFCFIDV